MELLPSPAPLAEVIVASLPWKSHGLFLDLDRQIESAFDELIHKPWGAGRGAAGSWPAVDVYETASAYLVVADVPGVAPAQLKVTVADNELVICGRRDVESQIRLGQTVRIEREQGEFCRRIRFAQAVEKGQVESRFEQGQLLVRLIKRSAKAGAQP